MSDIKMDELDCHICTKSYSSGTFQPRMLPCGHTLCTACLDTILSSSKSCPDCRLSVVGNSASDFPINFIVVKMIESHTQKGTGQAFLKSDISNLKDRYSKLEEQLNSLQAVKDSKLAIVLQNIGKLNDLISGWDRHSEGKVLAIKDSLNKNLNSIILSLLDTVSFEHPIFDVDFSISMKSSDFENGNIFLSMIYKKISIGQDIVAQLKINDKIKYAKLSIWKNRLKVHSFDPNETKRTLKKNIKTVSYRDLKKCIDESDKLTVFFTVSLFGNVLPCHIFLKLFDIKFKKYFILGCSGELKEIILKGTELRKLTSANICISHNVTLTTPMQFNMNVKMQSLFKFTYLHETRTVPKVSIGDRCLAVSKENLEDNHFHLSYGRIIRDYVYNKESIGHVIGICDLEELEECSTIKYLDSEAADADIEAIIDCGLSIAF